MRIPVPTDRPLPSLPVQFDPGTWINFRCRDEAGNGFLSGVQVVSHDSHTGMIVGSASWDASVVVTLADNDPSIVSHTQPDFDAVERLTARFVARETSREQFTAAMSDLV